MTKSRRHRASLLVLLLATSIVLLSACGNLEVAIETEKSPASTQAFSPSPSQPPDTPTVPSSTATAAPTVSTATETAPPETGEQQAKIVLLRPPAQLAPIEPDNVASIQARLSFEGDVVGMTRDGSMVAAFLRGDLPQDLDGFEVLRSLGLEGTAGNSVSRFAFAPDNRHMAWMPSHGRVEIQDAVTGEVKSTMEGVPEDCLVPLRFSPDGRFLTACDSLVWDAATGQPITGGNRIAFSPDGRYFALIRAGAGEGEPELVFELRDTLNMEVILSGPSPDAMTFSPDGRTLAYTDWVDRIQVVFWDLATRQEVRRIDSPFDTAAPMYSVGYSPDGQRLLWTARATCQLMDVASGLLGPDMYCGQILFPPDGSLLATTYFPEYGEPECRGVRLFDAATSEQRFCLAHQDNEDPGYRPMAFSPDGRLLATGDGSVARLWGVSSGVELSSLEGDAEAVTQLAFSADDRVLSTSSAGGRTIFWTVYP